MEELRMIRNLKREIEEEYAIDNAYELAAALVNAGNIKLSDDIREKILFLKQICKEVNLDNYWVVTLVAYHSLDEIKDRYNLHVRYAGKQDVNVDSLALSCEKGAAYVSLLAKLGLNSDQLNSIMKTIVNQGSIVKSVEDARIIIDDLTIFELPIDIRNQFICDNSEYLFNDYSKSARQVFETLIKKYGKEEGFACLKKHPEYIRLGVEAIKL